MTGANNHLVELAGRQTPTDTYMPWAKRRTNAEIVADALAGLERDFAAIRARSRATQPERDEK